MAKRVGIFPGTFDPVHNGHVAFARAAIAAANLDKVVFLPEQQPRRKQNVSSLTDRLAMLRLAITDEKHLAVLEPPDARFTVSETLPKLHAAFPGDQLVMLLGSDVAANLNLWPQVEVLLTTIELVIAVRDGDKKPEVNAVFVPTDHTHVTSSHVRGGNSKAVAPAVATYIAAHTLYKV